MTTDPNIVRRAPNVAALVGGAVTSQDGLSDRARGVMLGLAVGNLLGLPMEGDSYRSIERRYPQGILDIDPLEGHRPMDDDLSQAVDLGEALVGGGDYVNTFANRLVVWARENGRARLQQPELLVSDSAATCVVTQYAVTCQWSCVLVNAVIALLLRGVKPDLSALMRAASSDGAPDMLAVAERDDISTSVLASIADGTLLTSDASGCGRNSDT